MREVAARFADEAADHGASIAVDAPGPLRCELDVARMDQVVSNLVANAVKYGRGAPIRVTARAEGARAVIEVEDRGIGIAPELQERIFGRFERAVSGRNYPGLGLGLWIVRRLVESHGGAIRVRSAPGRIDVRRGAAGQPSLNPRTTTSSVAVLAPPRATSRRR